MSRLNVLGSGLVAFALITGTACGDGGNSSSVATDASDPETAEASTETATNTEAKQNPAITEANEVALVGLELFGSELAHSAPNSPHRTDTLDPQVVDFDHGA